MFSEEFKTAMTSKDWSNAYSVEPASYFQTITKTDTDYWDLPLSILDIINPAKDSKILDIGTWFGIMPCLMQDMGYTNVSRTESLPQSMGKQEIFAQLHPLLNINPFEFTVKLGEQFKLPEKYDLITIFNSNMHWKTDEVLHYVNGTITKEWQVTNQQGVHTFFTPWQQREWRFFIENIKHYLLKGGVCVFHPSPWVYDQNYTEGLTDTGEFLKQYQQQHYIPNTNPQQDYIVIVK